MCDTCMNDFISCKKIEEYLKCPKKYYYIKTKETPIFSDSCFDINNRDEFWDKKINFIDIALINIINRTPENFIKLKEDIKFNSDTTKQNILKLVLTFAYSDFFKQIMPSISQEFKLKDKFWLNDKLNICDKKEGTVFDVIDFYKIIDDSCIVISWKIGSYIEGQVNKTINIFAIYLFQKYTEINTIEISDCYIDDNYVDTYTIKREALENIFESTLEIIKDMTYSNNYEYDLTTCSKCAYKHLCGKICNVCETYKHLSYFNEGKNIKKLNYCTSCVDNSGLKMKKCHACDSVKTRKEFDKINYTFPIEYPNNIDEQQFKLSLGICNECVRNKALAELDVNNKDTIIHYLSLYPTYDAYFRALYTYEECRRHPEIKFLLQIKCTKCSEWYIPTKLSVNNRLSYINGKSISESRFYCSQKCKDGCEIFNQKKYPKGLSPYNKREGSSKLRKIVLERDEHTCQKCYSTDNLECHHIIPVKIDKTLMNNEDNCITLCHICHMEAHSGYECTTGFLANI